MYFNGQQPADYNIATSSALKCYFKADPSSPSGKLKPKILYTYVWSGGIMIGISVIDAGSPPPLTLKSWFSVKTSSLNEAIETFTLFLENRAIKVFIFLGFENFAYSIEAFRLALFWINSYIYSTKPNEVTHKSRQKCSIINKWLIKRCLKADIFCPYLLYRNKISIFKINYLL